jgi:mRNA interferase RelE/StbE
MTYQVVLDRAAEKDLAKLPGDVRERAKSRIARLATIPRPPQSEKLAGPTGLWRLRAGDYRIVYSIDDGRQTVRVELVKHRKDVYRFLSRVVTRLRNP